MGIDVHIILAVIGITGMGKSFWTKNKLINAIAKHQPVIIFDGESEYAGENVKDIPKKASWNSYNGIHEFMVFLNGAKELEGVHVISCSKESDYDYGIKVIYAMELPVCIMLEEAHFIFNEKKLNDVASLLIRIARFGRKKNMSLALITQRLMDVPKDIRTQLRCAVSFHQNDLNDVKSLERFDSNAPQKIVDFKPREYEIFGEIPEKIKKDLL